MVNGCRQGMWRGGIAGVVAVAAALNWGCGDANSAESPTDLLKLTTDRVVVFKDGYYLAVKSGTAVTNKEGEIHLLDVPDNAVLGSVWATSTKGKLTAMVASRDTIKQTDEKSIPCTQTIEILQANVGQTAKIVMQDKSSQQGKIVRVLTEATLATPTPALSNLLSALEDDAPDPIVGGFSPRSRSAGPTGTTVSGITGSQFILRTEDGDMLLQVAQIHSLTIREMKATLARTVTTTTNPKRLTLRFAEAGKPVDVSFMYFQSGLRWIPTYRVSLLTEADKKLANVDLQAEFLNEAEDLDNVPVDIVVGVPNFRFKDTPSPLILEQALRNVLQQAAPQLMGQQMSNASFASRAGERRNQQADDAPQIVLPAELVAGGAQDLFVYSLKKLKLMRGQRAALPIFSAQVPYRDIYTWDVHLTRNDIEAQAAASKNASPLALSENRVWHQIVLTNTTKFPWTTGPALLMQGSQPLAQELMTYASAGSEVRIPVTVSVDTQGTYSEEETARKLNALSVQGYHYAQIDKSTSLNLINRKSSPIEVEITFRTGGKAGEASDDGKISLNSHSASDWVNYQGYSAVNNSSRVVWRATLKPGESFAPSVKYHYFARH